MRRSSTTQCLLAGVIGLATTLAVASPPVPSAGADQTKNPDLAGLSRIQVIHQPRGT